MIPRYESAAPYFSFYSFLCSQFLPVRSFKFLVSSFFLSAALNVSSKCNRDYKNVHLQRLNCRQLLNFFFSSFQRYNNILYVYGSTDVRLHCNSNVCHEGLLSPSAAARIDRSIAFACF